MDMDEALLISLCISILIGVAIIGPTTLLSQAQTQTGWITIENADYVANEITQYSIDLIKTAENVTLRVVMEYGDIITRLDLQRSDDLVGDVSIVSSRIVAEYADSMFQCGLRSVTVPDLTPRIIVEYADSILTHGLQGCQNLNQTAITVTPRIIVEYADFIFGTDLGPKPMEDNTPPVIGNVYQQPANDSVYPDDEVVVYANVTDELSGVKQVILNYTTNNGTWFNREMRNLEDTVYNATIPEFQYCTNVTYVIIAEDNANNTITTEDLGYEYQYHVIPEFPSFITVPLFIIATLMVSIIYRRNQSKHSQGIDISRRKNNKRRQITQISLIQSSAKWQLRKEV